MVEPRSMFLLVSFYALFKRWLKKVLLLNQRTLYLT
jgi:hypothetical protein